MEHSNPNAKTREEEKREAGAEHKADRVPISVEEQEAEKHKVDPDVIEHEEEMLQLGAQARGEGRIEQGENNG